MILSRLERHLLEHLEYTGPMPVDWLKPKFRGAVPRLRELGLLWRRDQDWARLTKLGRRSVGGQLGD